MSPHRLSFSSSSEGESDVEDAFKRVEAIHLILPLQTLPPIKILDDEEATTTSTQPHSSDIERPRLRGYDTLQELREKVGTFRQGYLNWRKFKPRGARGEAVDIMSGRKDSTSGVLHAPLLHAMETWAMDDRRLSSEMRESSMEMIIETQTEVEVASPRVSPFAVPKTLEEEDAWLRFYFNPFTPAEEKQALVLDAQNLKALGEAPGRNLVIPRYNRDPATVTDWIMHLGVGQFHRSHQLVYMDDLLTLQYEEAQEGSSQLLCKSHQIGNSKWGYCGVGLMPMDSKMATALRSQDLLYTVLSRSNATSCARVVGSMFDYILAPEEANRIYTRLLDPTLRIVSLTVTEKGYFQNVQGNLNVTSAFIQEDLNAMRQQAKGLPPSCPKTAIGFLYLGLRERRARSLPPFTVMSCDNLPENGHVAKQMVFEFALELDHEMADWISNNVSFPSTMVDRITPQTAMEHREILAKDFGVLDGWPVVTEDYRQWVVEDNFSCGRPCWEAVSVLLTRDVRPFELMKLRLLNGGHSMLTYIAYLGNYRYVDDATNDVQFSAFLRSYMDEVTSTIRNVSVELERYKEKIVERFGNRMMKDLLTRICEDGSTKFYNTTRDPLLELVEENRHIHWSSLGIAAWILFLATISPEVIKDGRKEELIRLAQSCVENPRDVEHVKVFLRNVYGDALGSSSIFVNHVSLSLFTLERFTVKTVLMNGGILETIFNSHLIDCTKTSKLIDYALSFEAGVKQS